MGSEFWYDLEASHRAHCEYKEDHGGFLGGGERIFLSGVWAARDGGKVG